MVFHFAITTYFSAHVWRHESIMHARKRSKETKQQCFALICQNKPADAVAQLRNFDKLPALYFTLWFVTSRQHEIFVKQQNDTTTT